MELQKLKAIPFVLAAASLALLPMGCKKPPPITLSCAASAPAVFPGDPLSVTATAGSVATKKKWDTVYNWTGDSVTGNGPSATVSTGGQAPGSYTVKAEVKEGKKGKEGLKPGQSAQCVVRRRLPWRVAGAGAAEEVAGDDGAASRPAR